MNYFKKFQIVNHLGNLAVNIMARVKLEDTSTFITTTLPEDVNRSDIIAKRYYDSYGYDWLVKLSNQVIDPYYDLGLDSFDFEEFIKSKYGSLENAQKTIVHWKNDWESDDSQISVMSYNALTESQKRYWAPNLDYRGVVSSYSRAREDWLVNTNKVQLLVVTSHDVKIGQILHQEDRQATVVEITGTTVMLHHVMGDFDTSPVEGIESITSATVLYEAIPDLEAHYWSPVDAYRYELENNQEKRTIRLLDNRLKDQADSQVKKLVKS